jgi:hypothetical protein
MDIHTYRCSSCGKPGCCDAHHRAYSRYLQELQQLLAQPEVDRERITFLMFLIATLEQRFHVLKESAS